ncbi:biopolymer transport protein ExbB [Caenibius tardaugens NBRC 16725]|uniref:Biopolymer transport protein ExbB n=1 Tax=Caenibius tardaugens NBRC 16725 TaxID=1219035 RepID=U2Y760_9SPHN|nr:MotA/TolQ/ExbB proton channel family protein [Caenibius tardaugens]AZI35920.1 MotA/TolQ/ExbB proton channel family protein [Caenibius tardaugens NBRC 16725]GAD49031.1 biopolymer transport protein ExbB [Caenibius tardaugens NBRC 16725]
MLIEILAAAAEAAPQNKFGFKEALEQGGVVAYATVIILGIMSFGSFYILFTKLFEQQKILKQGREVRQSFWRANSLRDGAAKLGKNTAYRQIVDDALDAEEQHAKMTDTLEAHDWMHGSLARSENAINARLAGGLPFLATVGATAPFIGLFGTVVGIYRALINIGLAGSASIDKVAGPVGEALIMTALGLLVAVPAVLAYNWLQARNKRISGEVNGFATAVLANLSSGGAVKPALAAAPAAKPAAAAAKPAAAAAPKA